MKETEMTVPKASTGGGIFIRVNGRRIPARAGDTLLFALHAAGFRVLGKDPVTGMDRGAFCGMGVCFQCRVAVNGVENQRACTTLVSEDMEIVIDA